MPMYPNLKLQIWRSGIRQQQLAKMIGLHETVLSKIVNGSRSASPQVKSRIASALNADVAWLFEMNAGASSQATAAPAPSHDMPDKDVKTNEDPTRK